ncbi:MAG TPA: hypothetical protein VIC87_18610 [Vicinamibacteria bacterium]
MRADRVQIQQVVLNSVLNALEASADCARTPDAFGGMLRLGPSGK